MNIIPWGQIPGPTKERLPPFIDGVREWLKHTNTVMCTTRAQYGAFLYVPLREQFPNATFIGGFETYDMFGDKPYRSFDDAESWEQVAVDAMAIADLTGNNTVLLDNEELLKVWHGISMPHINPWELRESLRPLADTGLDIIMYMPTLHQSIDEFPCRQYEEFRLLEAIKEALPTAGFECSFRAYKDWHVNAEDEMKRMERLKYIVGEHNVMERLLVTPDGRFPTAGRVRECHTPHSARLAMKYLGLTSAIIWPGGPQWLPTAKAWGEPGQVTSEKVVEQEDWTMIMAKRSCFDETLRPATAYECQAKWGGDESGERFRCYLCGHKFVVGDMWRFVRGGRQATINFMTCEACDGPDVLERWLAREAEFFSDKFWALRGLS